MKSDLHNENDKFPSHFSFFLLLLLFLALLVSRQSFFVVGILVEKKLCLLSASPKLREKNVMSEPNLKNFHVSFFPRLVYASFFSSPFRIRNHFCCFCWCCCCCYQQQRVNERERETMEMMNEFLLFISTQHFHVDVTGGGQFLYLY